MGRSNGQQYSTEANFNGDGAIAGLKFRRDCEIGDRADRP